MKSIFLTVISVICSLAVTDSRPGDKFRGDTVPFMLVVQHSNGPRCAGALVSMRSAVSTASCVSLSQGPITAMAGPYLTGVATIEEAVRRITSVVLPVGYVASSDFTGAVNDVAVLRLEKPFGTSSLVKPILIEKEYAAYEKEGKLCNLVRALRTPAKRQRREEKNSLTDTHKSPEMTPIPRNLDFTISYEWFNLNNSDVMELIINKDKLNSTFSENAITQSTIDVGQNVLNTSNIPHEIDNSDWLENEANTTIPDSTFESAAIKNETIRKKRHVTSTTPNLNKAKQNATKYLVGTVTVGHENRTPATVTPTVTPTPAITIFRIYDVRTLNMYQCREDNILVGNRLWAAMSEQVVCTHGVNFCQTDWGTGLVCNGKLCALLSRVAHPTGQPIDTGCGTTHTLQSLGRWRRFLGCAHDRGNCDKLPCSKYCQENTLKLDEKYKLAPLHDDGLGLKFASLQYGKTKNDSNIKFRQRQKLKDDLKADSEDEYVNSDERKQKSSDSDDSDTSNDDNSDLSDDEQLKQQRNNHVTLKQALKEELPKLKEQLSPLKGQLPTLREQLPVLKERLPALNEQLPVLKEKLPVLKERLPALNEQLPVLKEQLPVLKERLPALNEQLPVLKEQLPVLREQLPVFKELLPVIEEQLPVSTKHLPVQQEHFTTDTSTRNATNVPSLRPTRTPDQYTITKSMTKELTQGSSGENEHNLVDFEPYRADFKAGEYGENAVDYRDSSEEDYEVIGNSSNAVHINSETHRPSSTTDMETSLTRDEISTTLAETKTTLLRDTSMYDLMPKLKYVHVENYKLERSDATIIGDYPLLELAIVFSGYLLR